ncbi:hypothetical protein EVAR_41743_1 [Eumeta japonica]|uniref:Uncharacterized protein n=1 Tax=Eumeta variegata TaxID=151549 RepID=A0A4C1W1A7_EUMVA|nr:hypothetical protein EVAR_41743_1 [Eumeta japonica]
MKMKPYRRELIFKSAHNQLSRRDGQIQCFRITETAPENKGKLRTILEEAESLRRAASTEPDAIKSENVHSISGKKELSGNALPSDRRTAPLR